MDEATEPGAVKVRPAVESDAAALAEVEMATPIVAGEDRITYDRTADYFAYARMMEASDVVVAEVDGRVVGVHAAAFHAVRVGGRRHVVNYIHHLRILPGEQGKKVLPLLKQVAVPRYPPEATASYVFVDARNRSILDRMHRMTGIHRWTMTPVLFELDTHAVAAAPGAAAAPARPQDAERICGLLQATHGTKELWPGTSVEELTARLSRDPAQYAWPDVLLTDRAVVGLWRIGRTTQVICEGPNGRTVTRHVVVADHGGDPVEVVRLLRSSAAGLAAEGFDRITIFVTEGSALADLLAPLAVATRRFEFWMNRVEQPPDAADLYVDPLYF